jgi:hypothetical protein
MKYFVRATMANAAGLIQSDAEVLVVTVARVRALAKARIVSGVSAPVYERKLVLLISRCTRCECTSDEFIRNDA